MSTFISVMYRANGGLEQRLINVDCIRSISPLDVYEKGCIVRFIDGAHIEIGDVLNDVQALIENCERRKRIVGIQT